MRKSDIASTGEEMVRSDVQEAVQGAFASLHSDNVVIRNLAGTGQLDSRCTSAPVHMGAL